MEKKRRIIKKIMVDGPPEEVYRIARDPKMWSFWDVGLEGPKNLRGKGEKGTTGDFTSLFAGQRFPLSVEVTEDHISPKKCRMALKLDGQVKGEQIYEYNPKGSKTEIMVQFEITSPKSSLEDTVSSTVIDRMHENRISNSLENLKVLAEEKLAGRKKEKMT